MDSSSGGVPVVVLYQVINVGALFALLFFLLRKKVAGVLAQRKEDYDTKVRSARQVVEEAEQRNSEIKNKINSIEASKTQALEEARESAKELKNGLVQDARLRAEQMKQDAQRAVQFEFEKAKNNLRAEVMEEVLRASQTNIAKNATEQKMEMLNKEFINGVRAN